jgi:hypothetical protein
MEGSRTGAARGGIVTGEKRLENDYGGGKWSKDRYTVDDTMLE